MDKISNTPGCKLLYTDTDSVFFACLKGMCPLELGSFLGELTDQYPDYIILGYHCTAQGVHSQIEA